MEGLRTLLEGKAHGSGITSTFGNYAISNSQHTYVDPLPIR